MLKQILTFASRWVANALGLGVAYAVGIIDITGGIKSFVISALILAVLNAIMKPLLIILTLPLITLTLGFFLIVINGVVMYLLGLFMGSVTVNNFLYAMLAGIIIGLLNYIVTILYERFSSNG